ncbi:MAG TPA: hypothetical protein VLB29_10940, partial [Nocardioidaceae bacterium]|nr:hypothetical protein [Nocardioidaceae bacterium]
RFFIDWQDFTGTTTPTLLDRVPRLILVARSFDPRTDSALQYLKETGVPWKLIQVVFYEDMDGKRVVDVNNGDLEGPSLSPVAVRTGSTPRPTNGSSSSSVRASSGVTLTDLLERGVLQPDEPIVWRRPQVGEVHHATIGANGEVRLQDGRSSASLSMAAVLLVGGNYNGWECWTVPRLGGVKIGTLRNVPAPPDGG